MFPVVVVVAVLIANLTIVLKSLSVQRLIILRLRERHQDLYREIGEPTDVPGPTFASALLDRFISTKQYLALDDLELRKLCARRTLLDRILVGSLILSVAGSMIFGLLYKPGA